MVTTAAPQSSSPTTDHSASPDTSALPPPAPEGFTSFEDLSGFNISIPSDWLLAPLGDEDRYQEDLSRARDEGSVLLAEMYAEFQQASTVIASRLLAFEPNGDTGLWVSTDTAAGRTLDDVAAGLEEIATSLGGTSEATPMLLGGQDGLKIEQSYPGGDSSLTSGAYKVIVGDLLYTVTFAARNADQLETIDEIVAGVTFTAANPD